jgi:hypothetical protein
MDLESFHEDLMSSIRVAAEVNRDFLRASFVEEAGKRLSDAEELNDFQICQFEGFGIRKRRLEVDGYCFDDADGSMALVIADFSNEDEVRSIGATETRRAFASLTAFVDEALSERLTNGSIDEAQPGYGLAAELSRLQTSIVRFRFYLVTEARLQTRTHEWPEADIHGIPVEFHIWDVERYHRAHEAASGRDALEISFCASDFQGLPFLESGAHEGGYEAYLCMIPGQVLASLYERYGSRLLEGNVRSFLTTKGKVNAGMQETIQSRPEMFFAYNNGIAATAESVSIDIDNRTLKGARNLQIVNGGQTTASLATAKRNGVDLSRVRVQMKLSVVQPVKAEEMIPLIAKYANSQNKVNDADFFANHPYHVRLEELSRKIWAPPPAGGQHGSHWFYERARGQYLNAQAGLSKAQKEQFLLQNPKPQLLTKTDIAKFENTWRGYPHKVSQGAQKNFLHFADWVAREWSTDGGDFDETYFRYVASLALLFRHTEALVSKQPWYQGGYRANVVTYGLAKLQYMVLKDAPGSQLDLSSVWNHQGVGPDLSEQIRLIVGEIFKVLTRAGRPKDNVTEWAKMERCWSEVQALRIKLNDDLLVVAGDAMLEDAQSRIAAGTVPVGHGLFAKTAVMGIDGTRWKALLAWGSGKGYLNPRESDLLRAAGRIPRFAPSAKDCERILKIKSKLEAKGYGQ